MNEPLIDSERLRMLDFDDLYLLRSLLRGQTLASSAKMLGLTQPAVTQRVRKIERTFETPLVERSGRNVRLTTIGTALCVRAAAALEAMLNVREEPPFAKVTAGFAEDDSIPKAPTPEAPGLRP